MSRYPYLKVNSAADQEALLRAVWPTGARIWLNKTFEETIVDVVKYLHPGKHPYWTVGYYGDELLIGIESSAPCGGILLNSPAHMAAFIKTRLERDEIEAED